mgnify:CR=1 FL=1
MPDISKNRFEDQITALNNTIEGLHEHIAMLQQDLYNEQLRNENLSDLALAVRSDMLITTSVTETMYLIKKLITTIHLLYGLGKTLETTTGCTIIC